MSSSISRLAKDLYSIMESKNDRKPKAVDVNARVVKIEDDILWVNFPGGEDLTPVQKTIDAKPGDSVVVRCSNGRAWVTGNSTSPPTDDTTANYAVNVASETNKTVINIQSYVADELTAQKATIGELEADTAKIHDLTADELTATVGYISDLTADNIAASDISADHATVGTLSSTYATIDELHSDYAEIDLANVNNAWIQNGVVKDAAISDAQIIGVSANKLTAGTIDASNITVTNLNASNITTGSITVDGITIDVTNNEATIDGSYIEDGTITLNGLAQEVTDKIDGAIETFTGTVVPTLNNPPASSWTTSAIKDTHIGDVYYVINAGNQADGYCYRFAKSGNTYQWVLIKDSDVTAALQRLTEAEGDIDSLESFESTTSSWMTETDEELSSVKSNVTSLTTRVTNAEGTLETKVDTSTFNTLSQTVGENSSNITSLSTVVTNNGLTSSTNISNTVNTVSQTANGNSSKISSLTTTLGTNADGTTKTGDIVHRTSDVEQDLSGFKTTVSSTYATKTALNGKADASAVYTKSEIDQKESSINASVSAKADGQATTAALALKANKDTLTSEINASADTVKIDASRLNITGVITAINNDTTTTIDGGKITTGSISLSDALSDAETKATNYISPTGPDGIFVSPESQDPSILSPANSVLINTSGMNFYNDGHPIASYSASGVVLGKDGTMQATISRTSFDLSDAHDISYFNVTDQRDSDGTKTITEQHTYSPMDYESIIVTEYSIASVVSVTLDGEPMSMEDVEVLDDNEIYISTSLRHDAPVVVVYKTAEDIFRSYTFGTRSTGTEGRLSYVVGYHSTATAEHSIAIGRDNEATASNSIALGRGLISNRQGQVVVGNYNEDSSAKFIIGGGSYTDISGADRLNLLEVDSSGYVTHLNDGVFAIPSTIISASTGTFVSGQFARYGTMVQMQITFRNTASTASGSNIFECGFDPQTPGSWLPVISARGCGYYGAHALIGHITTAGTITIRNASSTALTIPSGNSTTVTFTYVCDPHRTRA